MFVDRIKIKVMAGKGGNGVVAWRREKYIPKGGPYGGNGGRGGSVFFEADSGLFSLEAFRRRKILQAENGKPGGTKLLQGRSGVPLTVKVPYGTIIKDSQTQEILVDFTMDAPQWEACRGGKGGQGNAFFRSPTHQAPNICTPGKPGEEKELELELKLIADVGLVGMPNAGKSTLLSQMTHAQVKIGAYPFTTLTPNLAFILNEGGSRILVADIPGIIENAHLDKGLGLSFLKHIQRTSALVFVIDISGEEGRSPIDDFEVLRQEIRAYDETLLSKPFLIVLNKMDKEDSEKNRQEFYEKYPLDAEKIFPVSALEKQELKPLIQALRGIPLESFKEELLYGESEKEELLPHLVGCCDR